MNKTPSENKHKRIELKYDIQVVLVNLCNLLFLFFFIWAQNTLLCWTKRNWFNSVELRTKVVVLLFNKNFQSFLFLLNRIQTLTLSETYRYFWKSVELSRGDDRKACMSYFTKYLPLFSEFLAMMNWNVVVRESEWLKRSSTETRFQHIVPSGAAHPKKHHGSIKKPWCCSIFLGSSSIS